MKKRGCRTCLHQLVHSKAFIFSLIDMLSTDVRLSMFFTFQSHFFTVLDVALTIEMCNREWLLRIALPPSPDLDEATPSIMYVWHLLWQRSKHIALTQQSIHQHLDPKSDQSQLCIWASSANSIIFYVQWHVDNYNVILLSCLIFLLLHLWAVEKYSHQIQLKRIHMEYIRERLKGKPVSFALSPTFFFFHFCSSNKFLWRMKVTLHQRLMHYFSVWVQECTGCIIRPWQWPSSSLMFISLSWWCIFFAHWCTFLIKTLKRMLSNRSLSVFVCF